MPEEFVKTVDGLSPRYAALGQTILNVTELAARELFRSEIDAQNAISLALTDTMEPAKLDELEHTRTQAEYDFDVLSGVAQAMGRARDEKPERTQPSDIPPEGKSILSSSEELSTEEDETGEDDDEVVGDVRQDKHNLELDVMRSNLQPKKRRRNAHGEADGKQFSFSFRVEGKFFGRSLRVSEVAKLPAQIRLLLGIGQVNKPAFNFYETEEQRLAYVRRIVNKGIHEESEAVSEKALAELIEEATSAGYLHRNGNGLELTVPGLQAIKDTRYKGRMKLGNDEFK